MIADLESACVPPLEGSAVAVRIVGCSSKPHQKKRVEQGGSVMFSRKVVFAVPVMAGKSQGMRGRYRPRARPGIVGAVLSVPLLLLAGLSAKADIFDTLDWVDAYGPNTTLNAVIKMRVDESYGVRSKTPAPPSDPLDFWPTMGIVGAAPPAASPSMICTRGANRDMACIDGEFVRSWTPDSTGIPSNVPPAHAPSTLFSCRDPNLKLDTKKPNACTAIAVDPAGNLWLGARRANSHSVYKIVAVPDGAACPANFNKLSASINNTYSSEADYCFAEFTYGRPPLVDMYYVGGDVGLSFDGPGALDGPGLLIMEERKTVSFVPDPEIPAFPYVNPTPIGSGRTGWGLNTGEQIQSVTALRPDENLPGVIYALVTTSSGRILAKRSDGSGSAFQVFNVAADRGNPSLIDYSQCNGDVAPQYGIRLSPAAKYVYVSDRDCRLVRALTWYTQAPAASDPSGCTGSGPFWMCNAKEAIDNAGNYRNVTLSTGTIAPEGVSVIVGSRVNLAECLAKDEGGECVFAPGSKLFNVTLADESKTRMTVYPALGIPDCRYPPYRPGSTPSAAIADEQKLCAQAGVVVGPTCAVDENPAICASREFLNISKLMGDQIGQLKFRNVDGIETRVEDTQMLVSPMYMARPIEAGHPDDRKFDAYFGLTEDGLGFRQTFDLEIDITHIANFALGCGQPYLAGSADAGFLDWALVTTVSEKFRTASTLSPTQAGHVDMLGNTYCINPTSVAGTRWSAYPYNLQLNPMALPDNRFRPNRDTVTKPASDYLADLTVLLFDDIGLAYRTTALADVDGNGGTAPIVAGSELDIQLAGIYRQATRMLESCIAAAYGKQSGPNQNCGSLKSQLEGYAEALRVAPADGLVDKANRRGELQARVKVLLHVVTDHFQPSVPRSGFYNVP
jgi:hypothetical protein